MQYDDDTWSGKSEARNSKHETNPNNRMTETPKNHLRPLTNWFWSLCFLTFESVSIFVLRISNLAPVGSRWVFGETPEYPNP
jgi:hypothetical protein